jgi:hypothetical protein
VIAFSRLHEWSHDLDRLLVAGGFFLIRETMEVILCFSTGLPVSGENWVPTFAKRRRRKCQTSVTVATVDFPPPREMRCSMATVGGSPATTSMSGPLHLLDELTRVGRHGIEKATLSFGEKDVEGEGRFS